MRFFQIYQFAAPVILLPLGYLLWLRRYQGEHELVWLAISVPVVFAYVVPGLGMNALGLWEVNTRLRMGRMRPHHGFVFGTATSLFGLLCVSRSAPGFDLGAFLQAAIVTGSVIGFWNWLYDTAAIKSGFILVHNRLAAQGEPAEVVATDHAPVLFGVFGGCYGAVLYLADAWSVGTRPGVFAALWLGGVLAGVAVPVLAYVSSCYLKRGESGLEVYRGSKPGGGHEEFGADMVEGVPVVRVRVPHPGGVVAESEPGSEGVGGRLPLRRDGGLD